MTEHVATDSPTTLRHALSLLLVPWICACTMDLCLYHGSVLVPWICACAVDLCLCHGSVLVRWVTVDMYRTQVCYKLFVTIRV